MLGAIWSRIVGACEARSRAEGRAEYPLEQLEPRLLLSADLLKVEPAVGQSLLYGEHAICIDLDQEQVDLHSHLRIVTTFAMGTVQPDETGIDSQVGSEDMLSTKIQSTDEVAQRAQVDDPVDTKPGTESISSLVSLSQVVSGVEVGCHDFGTIGLVETPGSVVGDQQDVIPTSDTSSIGIRAPPKG
jgi:hypothetical protein